MSLARNVTANETIPVSVLNTLEARLVNVDEEYSDLHKTVNEMQNEMKALQENMTDTNTNLSSFRIYIE